MHKGQGDKRSQCKATHEDAVTLGTWVNAYWWGNRLCSNTGMYLSHTSEQHQPGIIKRNYERSKMIH